MAHITRIHSEGLRSQSLYAGRVVSENRASTSKGYRVEIRAKDKPRRLTQGRLIGTDWEALGTVRVPPEVGTSHQSDDDRLTDTNNYYGALALAASFMSADEWGLNVEARIVEFTREIKWSLERTEVLEFPSTFELEIRAIKEDKESQ